MTELRKYLPNARRQSIASAAIRGNVFLLCLLAAMAMPLSAQESEAWTLLRGIQADYDRINDYTVDIKAILKVPGLSVPEMAVKMYFKKPDKVHVESEGFAMLPRDAVMFHPSMFKPDEYDAVVQGDSEIRGIACRKIKLLAKSDTVRLQRVVLFVDPARKEILRMEADPDGAASASADFTYARVDGYSLPKTITIEMEAPMTMRRPGAKPKDKQNGAMEKAKISLAYSNYRINKGISDTVFEKKAKKK